MTDILGHATLFYKETLSPMKHFIPFPPLMARAFRRVSVATVVALAALASACSDSSSSVPSVVAHGARVDADNGQVVFVSVVLSAPARAAVEYENEFAGKFRTALSETAPEHVIPVVRLRANTTYQYAVGVEGRDGSLAYGARGTFVTGELPGLLATTRSETSGESSQDLILADYQRLSTPDDAEWRIVIMDSLGYAVWSYANDDAPFANRRARGILIQPNGNIAYQLHHCCIIEITPLGEVVNELIIPDGGDATDHEFLPTEDGRILYLGKYSFTFDDSANGGDSETTAIIDAVSALDPATGEVERVWDPTDFWDIRDPGQRARWEAGSPDWLHMNSLSKSADGGYIASLRNINQVISISSDFKTMRWRLGGPASDFDFPDPTDRFMQQHTATELPNGNILVFDNRANLPKEEGGGMRSRALELRLDFETKTAVKAWEFSPEPPMYSRILSGAYRLDNGNTLINFGHSEDFAAIPIAIIEADAQGREVFRLETIDPPLAEASHRSPQRYRAYPGPKSIMGETMLRAPSR